jgi:hypothetical protein
VRCTRELIELADKRGWFFSPKEVPLDTCEIQHLFSPYFTVEEIVPVTYFGLVAAQYLATLKDQASARRLAAKMLPALNVVDLLLLKLNVLSSISKQYLFCRIVLIRK